MSFDTSICLSVCHVRMSLSPLPRSHALCLSLSLSLSLLSLSLSVSLPPPRISLAVSLSHCISLSPPLSLVASLSLYLSLCIDLPAPHSRSYLSRVVSLSLIVSLSLCISLPPRSLFVSPLSLPSLLFSVSLLCLSLPSLSFSVSLSVSLSSPSSHLNTRSLVLLQYMPLSACYFESQVPPPRSGTHRLYSRRAERWLQIIIYFTLILISIYRVCYFFY